MEEAKVKHGRGRLNSYNKDNRDNCEGVHRPVEQLDNSSINKQDEG